jgi:dihydrofolate reductase
LIVAMAKNRVIGANGAIPWHLPDELRLFKRLTMGHHMIMGRRTWESIGKPLPGRTSVVVTRQPGFQAPGAVIARSLDEAIAASAGDDEIFVIGGSEIFAQALAYADRIYLTTLDAAPEGDTYMPEFEPGEWRMVSSLSHRRDERHAYEYRHEVYERVRR